MLIQCYDDWLYVKIAFGTALDAPKVQFSKVFISETMLPLPYQILNDDIGTKLHRLV